MPLSPRQAAEAILADPENVDHIAATATAAIRHATDALFVAERIVRGRPSPFSMRRRAAAPAEVRPTSVVPWDHLLVANLAGCEEMFRRRNQFRSLLPSGLQGPGSAVELIDAVLNVITDRTTGSGRGTVSYANVVYPTGHRAAFHTLANVCMLWRHATAGDSSKVSSLAEMIESLAPPGDRSYRPRDADRAADLLAPAAAALHGSDGDLHAATTAIELERGELVRWIEAVGTARARGCDQAPPDVLGHPDARKILLYLSRQAVARTHEEIEAGTGISRRTVGRHIQELHRRGLVSHPNGQRRREQITPVGRACLRG